ncbi:hypothetical protein ACYF6T_40810 [Streptomyces sp. 7R007]
MLVLRFPRSLLPLPARELRRLRAARIPGARGIGALTSTFLLQLARHMHEFSRADTARLSTLTLDALTAGLAGSLDTESVVPPHTRQHALMARIPAHIHDNLRDLALNPCATCTSCSSRTDTPSLAGSASAVWSSAGATSATNRLDTRPIYEIATRWGFTHPAHFSQAFRSAHDLSPRQHRQQSMTVHAD